MKKNISQSVAQSPKFNETKWHSLNEDSASKGEITLNGDEEYVSTDMGWMHVTCTPTDLSASSGNQYLIDLSDGSSNPAISIRLDLADDDFSCRIRDDSSNLLSSSFNKFRVLQDVKRSFGIIWDNVNGNMKLLSQGGVTEYSFTPGTFTQTIDKLNIGQRVASLDPLIGDVHRYGVGEGDISVSALYNKMRGPGMFTIAGGGQSLMYGYWDSNDASLDDGYANIVQGLQGFTGFNDKEIIALNGAEGGSGLDERQNATEYWIDSDTGAPGPVLQQFLSLMFDTAAHPDVLIWSQGETDSHKMDTATFTTRAEYKANLLSVFNIIRENCNPNMIVFIQKIGRRTAFVNTGGVQTVREIQQELVDENDWIEFLCETYDQGLFDAVHPTDVGFANLGTRIARRLAQFKGETVTGSTVGPSITSASRSGTTVTVTLSHDGGSDFTPTTGIEGFVFHDDGAEITINSAVRTDATTVTLTLASTPTGTEVLYYAYDAMLGINTANILKDNSAQTMPLRSTKIVL